jgi:hypothetical protein
MVNLNTACPRNWKRCLGIGIKRLRGPSSNERRPVNADRGRQREKSEELPVLTDAETPANAGAPTPASDPAPELG